MNKTNDELVCINLLKPVNLNLEERIREDIEYIHYGRKNSGEISLCYSNGKIVRKKIAAFYYFIHKLIVRSHSNNDGHRHPYKDEYFRMYSRDIIPLKTPNDFITIVSLLRTLNIIEMLTEIEKNPYREKAKANYFKLKEPFNDVKIVEHQIQITKSKALKVKTFINEMKQNVSEVSDFTELSDDVLKHQFHAISNLNFDSTSALTHITNLLKNRKIEVSGYNASFITLSSIKNERIIFSKSEKCGRIYSTVTCMPKEIRPFLKDKSGNSLIELDFSSFNAFALYKLLNNLPSIILHDSNVDIMHFEKDLEIYKYLLSTGDFYSQLKSCLFTNASINREEFKSKVLIKWLNGKPESKNRFKKRMDEYLPAIGKILNALKDKNYSSFSSSLMKMESELVNYTIYKKFINENPEAVVYTIFDCLLVEAKYVKVLESMMLEEGNNFFGTPCSVKITDN